MLAQEIGVSAIIPTRFRIVPIYRISENYRKEMKRHFPVELCNQRNKSETFFCNQIDNVRRYFINE